MSTEPTPVPTGLEAAGQRLWTAAATEFEWAEHELSILEEACRLKDRIVGLDALVSDEGMMLSSSQGSRLHPAIAEARQSRLALARLLATLQIPDDDPELPSARPVRGVYGVRGRRG